MSELKPGDLIEVDTRRLFMDDSVWTPAVFIRYEPSNKWANSGDMLIELGGRHVLWGRHYYRVPHKTRTNRED